MAVIVTVVVVVLLLLLLLFWCGVVVVAFMRVSIIAGRWPCLNWHFFQPTKKNELKKSILVLNSFGWTRKLTNKLCKMIRHLRYRNTTAKITENLNESAALCVCMSVFVCVEAMNRQSTYLSNKFLPVNYCVGKRINNRSEATKEFMRAMQLKTARVWVLVCYTLECCTATIKAKIYS